MTTPTVPDWIDIRCPHCHRWLAKVTPNWALGVKLGLYCTNCKREYVFPSEKPELTHDRRASRTSDLTK